MGFGPLAQPLFYQYKRTKQGGKLLAGQWICPKQSHPLAAFKTDQQDRQIQP